MTYKTYRIVHWDTQYDNNGDYLLDESLLPLFVNGFWTTESEKLTGAVVEDKYLDELLSKLQSLNPVVDSDE